MKLKSFSPENLPNQRVSKPQIGLNQTNGTVRFNKAVVEQIAIDDKDQVKFHQDEEEPGDWYVEVVKENGFPLRSKSSATGEGGLVLQSTALVRKIFDSINYNFVSGNVTVGEPVKNNKQLLFPLITSQLEEIVKSSQNEE